MFDRVVTVAKDVSVSICVNQWLKKVFGMEVSGGLPF